MKRSKFSLSNTKLLSCDLGELIPMGLTEVLPGDSIQQATSCLVRFAPLLAPVMHTTRITLSHWFVPNRLIWDEWEDFITGGPDGNNTSVFPTITTPASVGFAVGSLADYLGVPPGVASREVSALPFRAYALIFNEWYRDQDLQSELVIDKTSGPDTTTSVDVQNVAWEKDYFTTARPWEQKGPAITIPIGTRADVKGIGILDSASPTNPGLNYLETGSGSVAPPVYTQDKSHAFKSTGAAVGSRPDIYADLSGASAVTVNLLREALALQRFEEARARFGSRYTEYLRYLGVRSSDARLQRPEFLGGGTYPVQFSEVLQTAEGSDPVGELRGHGIGAARSSRYRRFFEEHGYVLSMLSVKPRTIYADGLERTWNRRTREDYWQRELQHIGQQAVMNKEVRFAHATPDGTFGYQDRYDEYRGQWSSIAGEFRDTLDFWHFARTFSSDPALNASFIKCVPTENPFAVPSTDVLYIMAKHSIQARRLVASSGTSFIF